MKDENYCTLGGRITHPPGIYSARNQGWLLSFSIAVHLLHGKTPLFMEIKVPGTTDRAKLTAFAERLPIGRKVTVHNAELQNKTWIDPTTQTEKISYHLFCRLDQIYLHELPAAGTGRAAA